MAVDPFWSSGILTGNQTLKNKVSLSSFCLDPQGQTHKVKVKNLA